MCIRDRVSTQSTGALRTCMPPGAVHGALGQDDPVDDGEVQAETTSASTVSTGVSIATLITISLPYLAVFFTASAVVALSLPIILEFGASPVYASGIFIIACLATILIQPIVGAKSDRSVTSLFNVVRILMAILVVGTLIFAAAAFIFRRSSSSSTIAIAIASIGLSLMVVSLNAVQTPLRALATSMAARDQQKQAHAVFGLLAGIGASSAYALAWLLDPEKWRELYFVLAAVLSTVTAAIMLRQRPRRLEPTDMTSLGEEGCGMAVARLVFSWRQLWCTPYPVKLLFASQFLCWASLQTFFSAITTWTGSYMFGGAPGSNRFTTGVQLAAAGQAVKSALQVPASAVLPGVAARVGVVQLYLVAQMVFTAILTCLFLLPPVQQGGEWSGYLSVVLGASVVLPISATQVLPFAILGQLNKESSSLGCLLYTSPSPRDS
eukprot:TRINITY_DN24400_c0_g1_i1.p1 TRINITY_DN24400_c0_g1~~TRINITY_DN24400_c0_g1_i1.p1  ORF type:complete len:437 (-),score=101.23 TRINITY_DN24400_c0_g1_i1:86-1396(-)